MSIFSNNLLFLSDKYSLSLRQVALKAGINPSTLTRIIKNGAVPRGETLQNIATVFGVDPWAMHSQDLSAPVEDANKVIAWGPADIKIETADLNNHAKLLEISKKANNVIGMGVHVVGSVILLMPTDELAPVIPRGAIVYMTVEKDQLHPDTSNGEEAIGVIDEMEDGKGAIAIGALSIVQGKMYITPTNPAMKDMAVEVCRVTGRVSGWCVLRKKSDQRYLLGAPVGAPCSPAES